MGWLGNLIEDDGYEPLREYLCVTNSNDPVVLFGLSRDKLTHYAVARTHFVCFITAEKGRSSEG